METLFKRYSKAMDDGRILIAFDDFVSCCVRLRAYTGKGGWNTDWLTHTDSRYSIVIFTGVDILYMYVYNTLHVSHKHGGSTNKKTFNLRNFVL